MDSFAQRINCPLFKLEKIPFGYQFTNLFCHDDWLGPQEAGLRTRSPHPNLLIPYNATVCPLHLEVSAPSKTVGFSSEYTCIGFQYEARFPLCCQYSTTSLPYRAAVRILKTRVSNELWVPHPINAPTIGPQHILFAPFPATMALWDSSGKVLSLSDRAPLACRGLGFNAQHWHL